MIDDLAGTDPWCPRGIEIRGRGEMVALPTPLLQIHPERIVRCGLDRDQRAYGGAIGVELPGVDDRDRFAPGCGCLPDAYYTPAWDDERTLRSGSRDARLDDERASVPPRDRSPRNARSETRGQ